MQVVEITDPDALAALRPDWRALLEGCADASPFQSPEWLIAWREAFLSDGLWALAVRDGTRLAGLAPFYIHRVDDGRRQLTLLGNGLSDRLDLIAGAAERPAVAAVVFQHLARSQAWDVADLRDLPETSPLLTGRLPGAAQDLIEPEPPCPVLAFDDGADLPDRRRRDLARCERRIEERGELGHRIADHASRAADLGDLIRLHGARWEERGEEGVFGEDAVRRFHESATQALLACGSLRLEVLTLDGRPVAAHYGLRQGRRGYSYIHAYEPGLAACAPGRLLLARVLDDARRDGLAEFDFLRGQETYKYEWGARDRPQFRRRIAR
jgi:CelD/BcsL family acetyltransferase involved in cellulose biosynthesis